jgi:hypothetical protein
MIHVLCGWQKVAGLLPLARSAPSFGALWRRAMARPLQPAVPDQRRHQLPSSYCRPWAAAVMLAVKILCRSVMLTNHHAARRAMGAAHQAGQRWYLPTLTQAARGPRN